MILIVDFLSCRTVTNVQLSKRHFIRAGGILNTFYEMCLFINATVNFTNSIVFFAETFKLLSTKNSFC